MCNLKCVGIVRGRINTRMSSGSHNKPSLMYMCFAREALIQVMQNAPICHTFTNHNTSGVNLKWCNCQWSLFLTIPGKPQSIGLVCFKLTHPGVSQTQIDYTTLQNLSQRFILVFLCLSFMPLLLVLFIPPFHITLKIRKLLTWNVDEKIMNVSHHPHHYRHLF